MIRSFVLGLLALFALASPALAASTPTLPSTSYDVGVCDPRFPQRCIAPNADGSITAAFGVTDAASTNGSSTVATGGTFQTALASSTTRKGCLLYNPSTATEPLFVSLAASPSTTTNSYILGPGDSFSCTAGTVVVDDAVKVTATTMGHTYILYSQ